MKFRGWDYIELAEHWNVPISDEEEEGGEDAKKLSEYLSLIMTRAFLSGGERVLKKHANDIRAYCLAMAQYPVGPVGVWVALSEEEDDWTLLQTFRLLVPIAWT